MRHTPKHKILLGSTALTTAGRIIRADAEPTAAEIKTALAELQKTFAQFKDANDERNIFLEIRAGTGGDESALFAGDLLRMYTRHCERAGWRCEIVSESPSELGGFKEVVANVAVGYNNIDVPACERRGVIATNMMR